MNRTEFHQMLDLVYQDITEAQGNLSDLPAPQHSEEELRYLAAVAVMAADRYYSQLTLLQAQRRAADPFTQEDGR